MLQILLVTNRNRTERLLQGTNGKKIYEMKWLQILPAYSEHKSCI